MLPVGVEWTIVATTIDIYGQNASLCNILSITLCDSSKKDDPLCRKFELATSPCVWLGTA